MEESAGAGQSNDGCLGPRGARLRGHEFHYATVTEGQEPPDEPLGEAVDATGAAKPPGSRRGWASGSFFHLIAARG